MRLAVWKHFPKIWHLTNFFPVCSISWLFNPAVLITLEPQLIQVGSNLMFVPHIDDQILRRFEVGVKTFPHISHKNGCCQSFVPFALLIIWIVWTFVCHHFNFVCFSSFFLFFITFGFNQFWNVPVSKVLFPVACSAGPPSSGWPKSFPGWENSCAALLPPQLLGRSPPACPTVAWLGPWLPPFERRVAQCSNVWQNGPRNKGFHLKHTQRAWVLVSELTYIHMGFSPPLYFSPLWKSSWVFKTVVLAKCLSQHLQCLHW